MAAPIKNVVIIGTGTIVCDKPAISPHFLTILIQGIIGVATAHSLSCLSPGLAIHLLDSSPSLFASASGKAGGFLARDWFRSATASLGVLSFDLHRRLADEHDGSRRWGYSPTTVISLPEARLVLNNKKGQDGLREGLSRSASASAPAPAAAADSERHDPTALPQWLAAGRDPTTTITTQAAPPSPANVVSSDFTTAQMCVLTPPRLTTQKKKSLKLNRQKSAGAMSLSARPMPLPQRPRPPPGDTHHPRPLLSPRR
jgi:FAD dependent oxidoreductase